MRRIGALLLVLTAPGLARADGAPPWARSHPVHITVAVADDITDVDIFVSPRREASPREVQQATPATPVRVRFDGSGSDRDPRLSGLDVTVAENGDRTREMNAGVNITPGRVIGHVNSSGRVGLLHAGLTVDEVYRVERDGRGGYRLVRTYSNRTWWHTGVCCSFWIGLVVALPWLRRRWMRWAHTSSPPAVPGEPVALPESN
ncbi:hypothetical protein J0H58_22510 [bacterium]|nr:hypothetical protein [bacterium]